MGEWKEYQPNVPLEGQTLEKEDLQEKKENHLKEKQKEITGERKLLKK